jgi:hypothetical protein
MATGVVVFSRLGENTNPMRLGCDGPTPTVPAAGHHREKTQ